MNTLKVLGHGVTLIVIALGGCSTTNSYFFKPDLSQIDIGMNKSEVIGALGRPDDVASDGSVEYLEYGYDSPIDGVIGRADTFYVRMANGKVESFGRKGDFGTTDTPPTNINLNIKQ